MTIPNDQPTPESVLFSRQRASDLRALDKDELFEAAKDLKRRVRVGAPRPAAKALSHAIFEQQTKKSDSELGFPRTMIAEAGDEFAQIASADLPDGRSITAYLVFCALHVLKLALAEDIQIGPAIDAMEITEDRPCVPSA